MVNVIRLQGLCGNDLVTYEKTDVSVLCKNQELIQKLEEALENIEDFLSEREKLITLCNNVKIALERTGASGRNIKSNSHQKCKCHHSFRKDRSGDNDKNLMGAILNDESRDDLSSDDTSPDMVACFGNGHRLTKHGYEYVSWRQLVNLLVTVPLTTFKNTCRMFPYQQRHQPELL